MKKSNLSKYTLLLICTIIFTTVKAQRSLPCKDAKIDTATARLFTEYAKKHSAKALENSALIRVYFHIFSNNDGTNTSATSTEVEAEYASLQASYSAAKICFYRIGVNYIRNTSLNMNFNVDNDPEGAAFQQFNVDSCINIYYVNAIKGTNTACTTNCGIGGTSLNIPSTMCLIAKGNIGASNTIGHEVGHCLGLLHTFEKVFGIENIDGSNSSSAGDQIKDTPADPFVFNGQPCFSRSGCLYTGSCTDPNGASNYTPPFTNLMSYWGANCGNPVATDGQFGRILFYISGVSFILNRCVSTYNTTLAGNTYTDGINGKTAINIITNGVNAVNFLDSSNNVIGGAKIILKPGFKASPTTGSTRIKTSPCTY